MADCWKKINKFFSPNSSLPKIMTCSLQLEASYFVYPYFVMLSLFCTIFRFWNNKIRGPYYVFWIHIPKLSDSRYIRCTLNLQDRSLHFNISLNRKYRKKRKSTDGLLDPDFIYSFRNLLTRQFLWDREMIDVGLIFYSNRIQPFHIYWQIIMVILNASYRFLIL